jgi:hypothetical protein
LGVSSEAVRLRLMAAIVSLRKSILSCGGNCPVLPVPLPSASTEKVDIPQAQDLPYLQLQTQPGGSFAQQRHISSFFRTPSAPETSNGTDDDEYANFFCFRNCNVTADACMPEFLSVGHRAVQLSTARSQLVCQLAILSQAHGLLWTSSSVKYSFENDDDAVHSHRMCLLSQLSFIVDAGAVVQSLLSHPFSLRPLWRVMQKLESRFCLLQRYHWSPRHSTPWRISLFCACTATRSHQPR